MNVFVAHEPYLLYWYFSYKDKRPHDDSLLTCPVAALTS